MGVGFHAHRLIDPFLAPFCHTSKESLAKSSQPSSALDIANMFEAKKVRWASSESKMTVGTIRLHLRILRRLSMAVADQGDMKYQNSALYFFDRNEELWGRRCSQVALQESTKYFDAFQVGIRAPFWARVSNASIQTLFCSPRQPCNGVISSGWARCITRST